jgi:hypothetical protein
MALKIGSAKCGALGTMIYISLQFKFVTESLENLNDVENCDSQLEQYTITSAHNQNTSEESNYRDCQIPATYDESSHTHSQAPIPE